PPGVRPRARRACSDSAVAVEHAAEAAEDGAFAALIAAGTRGGGDDAVGEAGEGQRLQPDFAGAAQGGEEQTFAAEERGLHPADKCDVVVDAGLESDEAAGVDAAHFARTGDAFVERAAGVKEGPAVALQALHDEAFATEEAGADAFVEGDADADAF